MVNSRKFHMRRTSITSLLLQSFDTLDVYIFLGLTSLKLQSWGTFFIHVCCLSSLAYVAGGGTCAGKDRVAWEALKSKNLEIAGWLHLQDPYVPVWRYSRSVSRALLRARSLSRSLRWLRRDSVPVSVSRPSRLLTALALQYTRWKTSVRFLMMYKTQALSQSFQINSPDSLRPTLPNIIPSYNILLSVIISVCLPLGNMELILWLCFKFSPSGQNSSFIVLRYVMCFSLSVINDQIPWEGAFVDNTGINETYWKPRWCLQRDCERGREERMTECIKNREVADQVWAEAISRPVHLRS